MAPLTPLIIRLNPLDASSSCRHHWYRKSEYLRTCMKFSIPLLPIISLMLLASCEPKPVSQLSADDGINRIRSQHKDRKWEQVIQDVNEYKSRYPYTKYAAEADLLQGDSYFNSKRYPEATIQYEEFLKRNPSHAKASFAAFRVAQSQDNMSPVQVDREQGYALNAREHYRRFLEKFPKDDKEALARERIKILSIRLAEHTLFVARFYKKKSIFSGALHRYKLVLQDPTLPEAILNEARLGASQAYEALATALEKDPKSDKNIEFLNRTPEELRSLSKQKP